MLILPINYMHYTNSKHHFQEINFYFNVLLIWNLFRYSFDDFVIERFNPLFNKMSVVRIMQVLKRIFLKKLFRMDNRGAVKKTQQKTPRS